MRITPIKATFRICHWPSRRDRAYIGGSGDSEWLYTETGQFVTRPKHHQRHIHGSDTTVGPVIPEARVPVGAARIGGETL
jgi:hypothetical protein